MVLYRVVMRYESLKTRKDDKDTLNPKTDEKKLEEMLNDANDSLGKECGLDDNLSVVIVDGRIGRLDLVIACNLEKITYSDGQQWIKKHFSENFAIRSICFEKCTEISTKDFIHAIEKAGGKRLGYHDEVVRGLGLDYLDNFHFRVQEAVFGRQEISRKAIYEKAAKIMADKSLIEELDRIYADENEKKYYGNPVHYKISAGSMNAAKDIIEIMILALRTNNRLLGSRLDYIYNIREECYREDNLANLFKAGKGEAVAIDMSGTDEDHGIYASSYREVIDDFSRFVKENQLYTLCFFVEITEKPGFTKSLVAAVQDDIHLIEIKEGRGDKEQALDYLEKLAGRSEFGATRIELEKALPKRRDYSASDVYTTYSKWFSIGLKSKIYQSYKECKKVKISVKTVADKPYEELQNMVGLDNVKELVDQIINTAKIKKARSDLGMDTHNITQHMLFTGNPGSAKTTVARLLAEILKKEDTIETGNFVECGRADLIARYVGWTAKTVREKFNEANGGILFIDEAYALLDDSNTFGTEAINTIVQEMENRRDKVIVIFAGYPEKMERFLSENEGLRSRIAFHLDFPDYKADEMLKILELMAKEKGYKLNDKIREKCFNIFESACDKPEFGNGRFARNVLEQAMMRQADRVFKKYKGKTVSRRALSAFAPEDFDVTFAENYVKPQKVMGFVR